MGDKGVITVDPHARAATRDFARAARVQVESTRERRPEKEEREIIAAMLMRRCALERRWTTNSSS